ncbi:hypothetical protein STEG23_015745, partial [Scotinomys teguina]
MGYKAKQRIYGRRISNGQKTFKEVLNILTHQRNANENNSEVTDLSFAHNYVLLEQYCKDKQLEQYSKDKQLEQYCKDKQLEQYCKDKQLEQYCKDKQLEQY